MLYYLPGCDVNKNHPEAGKKIHRYLREGGAKTAGCCLLDVSELKPGDTVIENCTQCDLVLKERCPGVEIKSLYEFLLEDADFPWADFGGEEITVQDCFRTRGNRALQDSVRACLEKMNLRVVEMPENHEKTRFCGVWLNNPAAELPAKVAPKAFAELEPYRELLSPDEQKAKMEEWASQYETEKVAVYCNGCEKGIRLGGGHPEHLIELLAAGL